MTHQFSRSAEFFGSTGLAEFALYDADGNLLRGLSAINKQANHHHQIIITDGDAWSCATNPVYMSHGRSLLGRQMQ